MATTAAEQTAATAAEAPVPRKAARKMVGEWFWRFLAVVMLVTVGWVLWIIYQINPQPLITPAGLEAGVRARASQDAKGKITPAAPVGAADAAKAPVQAPPAERKEPPVNVERLRLADTIETPIPEGGKKK